MSLLSLLLVLVVIGVVLWLVQTYIPMPAPIKTLIIVVVVFLVVWIFQSLGIVGPTITLRH